jgi:prevent-host-death family protein
MLRSPGLKYLHEIRPLSAIRRRTTALLQRLRRLRKPVILVEGGEPKAVLLDVKTYSELRETELLLQVMAEGRRQAQGRRPGR